MFCGAAVKSQHQAELAQQGGKVQLCFDSVVQSDASLELLDQVELGLLELEQAGGLETLFLCDLGLPSLPHLLCLRLLLCQ